MLSNVISIFSDGLLLSFYMNTLPHEGCFAHLPFYRLNSQSFKYPLKKTAIFSPKKRDMQHLSTYDCEKSNSTFDLVC